ncbi:hypothetical protein [Sagittula sp. SSi028]|uniref:hypothetical protein n=1 Tax=Sagittula sp. SSi028 TaxID=3400636 RepID=UPI003AF9A0BF
MHALFLDSRPDRLDLLQIAFLEAGIHVTGSGSLGVVECCLRRAMVDVLVLDEVRAGRHASDIAAMAMRRNPKVVTLMLADQPDAVADQWSDRISSLCGVMEHDCAPAQIARMAKAALAGQGAKPEAVQQQAPAAKPAQTQADGFPVLKVHPALAAQRAAEAQQHDVATGDTASRLEAARQMLEQHHRARAAQTSAAKTQPAEEVRLEQARAIARQRAMDHAAALRAAQPVAETVTHSAPPAHGPLEHYAMPKPAEPKPKPVFQSARRRGVGLTSGALLSA